MRRISSISSSLRATLLSGLVVGLPLTVIAADADQPEEIVITGYRASLNKAIDVKRNATSQVDVIIAEDIAKFPDQNLAESLQRIPGIAIERDAGEGRAITVRGLPSQYTEVRLNGMPTNATATDGASADTERGFDFNVFASELFNSIVVHKTAEAGLDEGSLGAVVDLNTGTPLAYGAGSKLVGYGQMRYNDLNSQTKPRVAGLYSWNNADQTLGVMFSGAWSKYNTAELGNNSVRWAKARFRSVNGVTCTSTSTDPGCVAVTGAFHPRIPRYGLVSHDRDRLGLTAALQYRPNERTNLEIDALYSDFKEKRDEFWGEVLLRSNESSIDLSNYVIDGNNNIISAHLDNVYVRTERYHRESETKFDQISAKLEHQFSDRWQATFRAGTSKSDADIPIETSLMFDNRDATGYSYDYTDMKSPLLVFGSDVADPTAYQLAEFRDRPSLVHNKFQTLAVDVDWKATDNLHLLAGPFARKFDYNRSGSQRDSLYCVYFPTCAPGTYGAPVTAALAQIFHLGDAGQPAGNTNSWAGPDLAAGTAFIDLYNIPAVLQQGQQQAVTEKVTGGYLQANFDWHLGSKRITGNIGGRYAKTDQSSQGFVSGSYVTVSRTYNDFLPAVNVNFFPMDDFIIRAAAAKVLTRPSLGTLTPGGSIDQFNFGITSGNPFIEPFRATNYDLAFEWYFARGAIASIALFKKDVKSFPISSIYSAPFSASGLPTSLLTPGTPAYNAVVGGSDPNHLFDYKTTVNNGNGATLDGVELNLQLPFSVFSERLRNFGFLGNVTRVNSSADYAFTSPAVVYSNTLPGVSNRSANATLYYDDGKLSIRGSVAYRSGYFTGTSGNGNYFEGFDAPLNVDAALRYKLNPMVELSLDGTNLTDDYRFRWTDEFARRNYENNHFGRTITAGVRVQL